MDYEQLASQILLVIFLIIAMLYFNHRLKKAQKKLDAKLAERNIDAAAS